MGAGTKAFIGAILGRLFAALLIAVCVVLGAGPDRWAAWVFSDLLTPFYARIGLGLLGVFVFLFVFGPPVWRGFAWLVGFAPQTIPIWDAGIIAYEALEGFAVGENVDAMYGTAEGRTAYFVNAFLTRKLLIEGKKPPSTLLRPIPKSEMASLIVMQGTSDLFYRPPLSAPGYREVRIRRSDLNKYIRSAKRLSKALL